MGDSNNTHHYNRLNFFKMKNYIQSLQLKYYRLQTFITNCWKFRKVLSSINWWDYSGILFFLETAITDMANKFEKESSENKETKMKKVYQMRRASHILTNHIEDNFLHIAENKTGLKFRTEFLQENNPNLSFLIDNLSDEQTKHNDELIKKACEIEKLQWEEFCNIIHGDSEMDKSHNYSGRGLKTWW